MKTLFASFIMCLLFVCGMHAQELATVHDRNAPAAIKANFTKDDAHAYTYQRMPVFVGGEDAMLEYLEANVSYPDEAREYGVEGTVTLLLTISPDGDIKSAEPTTDLGFGLEEEAVRVASAMPNWLPGIQGIQAVKCKVKLPIRFTLK